MPGQSVQASFDSTQNLRERRATSGNRCGSKGRCTIPAKAGPAGSSAGVSQSTRSGVSLAGESRPLRLGLRARWAAAFHPAGDADSELLRRELQRNVPRRMPQRQLVRQLGGCLPSDQLVATRLQASPSAQLARRSHPDEFASTAMPSRKALAGAAVRRSSRRSRAKPPQTAASECLLNRKVQPHSRGVHSIENKRTVRPRPSGPKPHDTTAAR
jgi:hypothetical protein